MITSAAAIKDIALRKTQDKYPKEIDVIEKEIFNAANECRFNTVIKGYIKPEIEVLLASRGFEVIRDTHYTIDFVYIISWDK